MKKGHLIFFSIVLIGLLFGGCMGEQLGRLEVNALTTNDDDLTIKSDTLQLEKDDQVVIWSEMDIEYEGDVALLFKMQILLNGELLTNLDIDPTEGNVTINAKEISLGNSTSKSFTKKNMTFTAQEKGTYTFTAYLIGDGNPSLVLHKAEVLLTR